MKLDRKKISTKVWRPVINKLNRKLDKACLRRDAYLECVLDVELPYLNAEVALPNSEAASRFISERLDHLDRKLVSLSLRTELVAHLDDICASKHIARDAFFNRIFFLLAASPKVIDRLFYPLDSDRWRTEVWSERKHDGPFFQNVFYPLEPDIDPFWAIRTGLEVYEQEKDLVDYLNPQSGETIQVRKATPDRVELPDRIYTTVFDDKVFKGTDLFGLNTYLPDWQIPGHPAERTFQAELDDLLQQL